MTANAVALFMAMLADEPCEAAEFYNEKTFQAKCLDRNYNEYPDEMERCRPCAARVALIRDGAPDRWRLAKAYFYEGDKK